MLELRNLKFAQGENKWNFQFTLKRGELVQLIGENGSGKTTLLQILGGFLHAAGGEVLFDGKSILENSLVKGPTASLFQQRSLFPHLTIYQNVALACIESELIKQDAKKQAKKQARQNTKKIVEESLDSMGIAALKDRYPDQISEGQAQLAALARLSIQKHSEVLLLDEPISALDPGRRLEILERLQFIVRKQKRAAIITTHAPQEVAQFTDRAMFLAQGKIQFDGKFDKLLALKQKNPFKNYFCPRGFS